MWGGIEEISCVLPSKSKLCIPTEQDSPYLCILGQILFFFFSCQVIDISAVLKLTTRGADTQTHAHTHSSHFGWRFVLFHLLSVSQHYCLTSGNLVSSLLSFQQCGSTIYFPLKNIFHSSDLETCVPGYALRNFVKRTGITETTNMILWRLKALQRANLCKVSILVSYTFLWFIPLLMCQKTLQQCRFKYNPMKYLQSI